MDATEGKVPATTREEYKCRPGGSIWFFRRSRDVWKRKYQQLRAIVKGLKNQVAAVTKSREQWRLKAEQAGERASDLEAEVAGLRARLAAHEGERNRREERPVGAHAG
jgi:hypothetical protein